MKIFKVFLICLVSYFGVTANDETVTLPIHRDPLHRSKRSKVHPLDIDNSRLNHKIHTVLPKTFRRVRPVTFEPKTNVGKAPSCNVLPVHYLHRQPNPRITLITDNKHDYSPKNVEQRDEISFKPLSGFYTDIEDVDTQKLPTDSSIKHEAKVELETKPTIHNKNIHDHATKDLDVKVQKTPTENTQTSNGVQDKESISKKPPSPSKSQHVITEQKEAEHKLSNKTKLPNNENSTPKPPLLNSTPEKNRTHDIQTLLLKPLLENNHNISKTSQLTGVSCKNTSQNDHIDSFEKILQNNTQVTEKTHPTEICNKPEASVLKGTINTNEQVLTAVESLHKDAVLPEIVKSYGASDPVYSSSITSNENVHSVYFPDAYKDAIRTDINENDESQITRIESFKYPSQERTNTYTFEMNDCGNIKSNSVEQDEKNISWKILTNTEVLIKTTKNDQRSSGIEPKPVAKTVYSGEYKPTSNGIEPKPVEKTEYNGIYEPASASYYNLYDYQTPAPKYYYYSQKPFQPYYQNGLQSSFSSNYYNNEGTSSCVQPNQLNSLTWLT